MVYQVLPVFFIISFLFYVYEHLSINMYVHQIHCLVLQEARGFGYPGTGVRDGVTHHVNAGNQTQVICKNSE